MYQKVYPNWTQYVYVTFGYNFWYKTVSKIGINFYILLSWNWNVSKSVPKLNTICICEHLSTIFDTWVNFKIKMYQKLYPNRTQYVYVTFKYNFWYMRELQNQNVSKIVPKLNTICICTVSKIGVDFYIF